MSNHSKSGSNVDKLSRRDFFKVGGIIAGGTALSMSCGSKKHKVLGRTGFKVSDIAIGGTKNKETSVIRYAYDKGVNYFDTAEGYFNGDNEKAIGEALKFMERKKVFITSKIRVNENDTKETVLDRFNKCQERLDTEYIDAFYMHNPNIPMLNHEGFHAAFDELKSDGKVKFAGLSCHGGRGNDAEKTLLAAAEDGRFDLMLLIYNFMNKDSANKVLATCKEKNIGTTAMKTAPGVLKVDSFDPEKLTEEQQKSFDRYLQRGSTKAQALERLKGSNERNKETHEKTKPFLEKYPAETPEQLRIKSIHWAMQNPDMHTVCVSFSDFELIDKVTPLSGTKLSHYEERVLRDFELVHNDQYCRHGCIECNDKCPQNLSVSSIMRYAYYFEGQSREKEAMQKYARLNGVDASSCLLCDAPCNGVCPNNLDVQAQLLKAHSLLSFVSISTKQSFQGLKPWKDY